MSRGAGRARRGGGLGGTLVELLQNAVGETRLELDSWQVAQAAGVVLQVLQELTCFGRLLN